ncbi:MAG: ATP-binding protein, partial [Bdellovibrionota bacterium]|nr:ATP-binding protein [Bdellovibrionota bacterium]
TLSIVYITGALPEWFIFKNGAKIGITIQFTLLSLGLADVINALRKEALTKAENLNKAKLVLADLNKNLEHKVLERTKDLNFALKEVENLLNNMRQAVFTADKDGTILSPVSIFSETIFEGKVQNKKIDDTLFKGIDKKSELFSTIQFSYTHIFGADDLQWEMVKDHFPRRVVYKSSGGQEKILQVTYTPLWDQNNLLNRVMFIVEDITEIEKLEKEMEEQKLTSLKNIQILQELASNKKDDLHSFFSKTNQTLFDATYLAKKMRSLFETTNDLNELHLFYRHLHTIKGNARIFNLGFVSKYSHKVESDLIEVMDKCDQNEIVDPEDLNRLVQGMYELQGQINEYLKAAKDVFSLEFDEDKKYKEKLHDLVKNLEHWSSQLFLTCAEDPTKKITVLKEDILEKIPYRGEIIQELKDLTHSLKGLARCLGEREISEEVHFFEGAILSFYDSEEKMNIEKFTKFILNPLGRIKDLSYNIFLGAQKFKSFENKPEKWSLIFLDVYEMFHFIQKDDLKEISQKVYNLHVTMAHLDMYFLPAVTNLLYCIISIYGTSVKMVSHIMKVSLEYLLFLCSLDNNRFYTKEETANIVKILTEGQGLSSLNFLERDSIFLTFLKKATTKGYNYGDVLSDISKLLEIDTLISDIFPQKDFKKPGEDLFYELKKSFSLTSINNIEHLHKKDGEFFINFKKWFCKDDDLGINHYLKRVDLAKILKTFCVSIDSSEKLLKPKTYDVLIENYHQCFENLLNKVEEGHQINPKMINQTFAKLLYLPIKHSFYKFSSIVEDVSGALGKKINFRISGDQGGLEKDRLALLQDALIHLVRNSIDHGIETPSERISSEKAQMGTIEINCLQINSEKFQIILKDDGNGIDTHKLVQKCLEKGLIKSEELNKMSEEDKLNLMFLPNLSTKESVSEISGRGVGMEVVSNNLRDLGATLD